MKQATSKGRKAPGSTRKPITNEPKSLKTSKSLAVPASKGKVTKPNSSILQPPKGNGKQKMELQNAYTEDSIKSLDWREHIRLRPGMYIGKLGDGSSPDDGIYVLVKEVIDNCIDEYTMGYGKTIEVTIDRKQ